MRSFTSSELRTLRSLRTPARVQNFLAKLPYHLAGTAFSPRLVLRERTAHCLEGAIFAAAAFRVNGRPPLLLDLEAVNDTDHVIAPFREKEGWGAVALSNFSGLRFRAPVYRTLRELVMSYFDDYLNLRGERTLRNFSRPVNLARFDPLDWMTNEKDVWFIAEHLCVIPHTPLLTPRMARGLPRADGRGLGAAKFGMRVKRGRDSL
jgi:hypothetical protein